ncbi:tetratricopeptide repeat protein [Myxococcota bacterium]|nr:tetratricopeptide repeat protein [Myxococcota bacterium]
MSLPAIFAAHRSRFLSSEDLADRLEQAIAKARSLGVTPSDALSCLETLLCYAPYNTTLHHELARLHAQLGNQESFADHLSVCYDMNPSQCTELLEDPLLKGFLSDEEHAQVWDALKQEALSRKWNVVSFLQIAPSYGPSEVELQWKNDDLDAIDRFYYALPEGVDRWVRPQMDRLGFLVEGSRITLESNADRTYCFYGLLHQAIRDIAPFVQDAHFFMSTSCKDFFDECWIVAQQFFFRRHPSVGYDSEEQLLFLQTFLRQTPEYALLRNALSHEWTRDASVFVRFFVQGDQAYQQKAEFALDQSLFFDSQNPEVFYQKAQIALYQKQTSSALEALQACIRYDAHHFHAHYALGKLHFDAQDYAKAIASFDRAAAEKPHYNELQLYRGMALSALGRHTEAKIAYLLDIEHIPYYNSFSCNLAGNKLYQRADYQEALLYYEAVFPKHRIYEADLAQREAKSTSSSTFYQQRRDEIFSREIRALYGKAACFFALEDYPQAIAVYEQILQRSPEEKAAYQHCATSYLRLHQYEKAEDCLRRYLEKVPNDPTALRDLGNVLTKTGKHAEAEDCFEKAKRYAAA